jgi:hypothetical protein
MSFRGQVSGVSSLLGREPLVMGARDEAIVQALVHMATIGPIQAGSVRQGAALAEQLQAALKSRVTLEQAKGALAQARGVSVDEAFTMLQTYARSSRQRMSEVAAVVAGQEPARTAELGQTDHGERLRYAAVSARSDPLRDDGTIGGKPSFLQDQRPVVGVEGGPGMDEQGDTLGDVKSDGILRRGHLRAGAVTPVQGMPGHAQSPIQFARRPQGCLAQSGSLGHGERQEPGA